MYIINIYIYIYIYNKYIYIYTHTLKRLPEILFLDGSFLLVQTIWGQLVANLVRSTQLVAVGTGSSNDEQEFIVQSMEETAVCGKIRHMAQTWLPTWTHVLFWGILKQ